MLPSADLTTRRKCSGGRLGPSHENNAQTKEIEANTARGRDSVKETRSASKSPAGDNIGTRPVGYRGVGTSAKAKRESQVLSGSTKNKFELTRTQARYPKEKV